MIELIPDHCLSVYFPLLVLFCFNVPYRIVFDKPEDFESLRYG